MGLYVYVIVNDREQALAVCRTLEEAQLEVGRYAVDAMKNAHVAYYAVREVPMLTVSK